MRLINVETLKLEDFQGDPPPYAILSHTWGEEEVTLQDVLNLPPDRLSAQQGWRKVVAFCAAVRANAGRLFMETVQHAWVDTCCIDKTSSAELSEAINSMFRWYRGATVCFIFFSDVDVDAQDGNSAAAASGDFEASRWFTRGWTLQELLAPRQAYFFDQKWLFIGDKMSLSDRIAQQTGIDLDVILTGSWEATSVAERMSWAAKRRTTRCEDLAYCLLGIFDVNMPLLYGEGDKAFIRLQEEIMKESCDQSILAWDASGKDSSLSAIGALATHPSQFHGGAAIEALDLDISLTTTQKGIQSEIRFIVQQTASGREITVALLECRYINDLSSRVGIPVQKVTSTNSPQYVRTASSPICVPLRMLHRNTPPAIYLVKRDKPGSAFERGVRKCWVRFGAMADGFEPVLAIPQNHWHISPARSMTMTLPRQDETVVTAVAFKFKDSPGSSLYCVVLKLDPKKGIGMVGLRANVAEADADSKESLETLLEKLIRNADSIAKASSTHLFLDEWTSMYATLSIIKDSGSVCEVLLSSKGKTRPPTKKKTFPF